MCYFILQGSTSVHGSHGTDRLNSYIASIKISEELKFKTDISWQGKDGFQTITKYADFIFEQPLFSLTKELTRTTATGTFFVFKNSLVCDWVFGILIFCYSPYIPPPFWEDIKLYFQFAPLSMPVMAW